MSKNLPPVNFSTRSKKGRICELFAGRQLTPSDVIFLHATKAEEIAAYLNDPNFQRELERNRRRIDHVTRHRTCLSIISGSHVSHPTEISFEAKLVARNKINFKKNFGIDFCRHAVQIALVAGVDVAARLLNVEKEDILGFMRSEEARIKEHRDDVLNRVVSKSLDVMDTYMDELLKPEKLTREGVKDIAYAMGIVADQAKGIVQGGWAEKSVNTPGVASDGSSVTNMKDITNIVNILIHDDNAKSQVMQAALKKMNIYSNKMLPTAEEVRKAGLLGQTTEEASLASVLGEELIEQGKPVAGIARWEPKADG
jgi:hypothetical protein